MTIRQLCRTIPASILLCLSLFYISSLIRWSWLPHHHQQTNSNSNTLGLVANATTNNNLASVVEQSSTLNVITAVPTTGTLQVKNLTLSKWNSQRWPLNGAISEYDLKPTLPPTKDYHHLLLEQIFISVKTTRIFHQIRVQTILDTWFRLAPNQTYFFTDTDDSEFQRKSGGHLINTNCTSSHNRKALCCKMSVEFDFFIASNKKWFCHFDDDNYVNVARLVLLLRHYNPLDDWYLGKPSVKQPLEVQAKDSKHKVHFSFATGGAGFCISRALALKMVPIASDGKLISVGDKIRLPDDVTIGYIVEHLLSKQLTVVPEFHSHLESMAVLPKATLVNQVSFSYSGSGKNRNVVSLKGPESLKHTDPSRFYALHCHLYPIQCKQPPKMLLTSK